MDASSSTFQFPDLAAQATTDFHDRPPRLASSRAFCTGARMFAIPTPGRSVPIPVTRTLLPATGQNIGQVTQYWQRRLHEGDITLSEAPPAATPAATEAAKAASTAASPAPASAPAANSPPPATSVAPEPAASARSTT
ncbi:MAG: DUF2635 domain-containing protein [Ralstonia sp.]